MPFFDEKDFKMTLGQQRAEDFADFVKKYDDQMIPVMKARGFTCIHSMERTVAFTFGEFTFRRRRWKKGDEWVIPVDEKLGLDKHTRFSLGFLHQVAKLSGFMPYSKVVEVIEMMYQIIITKPIVIKAVKLCEQLFAEQAEYRFYQEELLEKIPADVIYIEGDGVMVKARGENLPNKNFDLSHFVVHTGSRKVGANRYSLESRKVFVSLDNRTVREQVLDYLHNHFEISDSTVLITNSDHGHGYTPYVFKEFASALKIQHHEHFWDAYHVNQKIKTFFKAYPQELEDSVYEAIQKHDKKQLRLVLDTVESLIVSEEELSNFNQFKKKLLGQFQYTKPANLRGFSHAGIGIMESQHRRITYRMKKRGMYWTKKGAETMSRIITAMANDEFEELFFGSWRADYQKYKALDELSVSDFLDDVKTPSQLPKVHLNLPKALKDL